MNKIDKSWNRQMAQLLRQWASELANGKVEALQFETTSIDDTGPEYAEHRITVRVKREKKNADHNDAQRKTA